MFAIVFNFVPVRSGVQPMTTMAGRLDAGCDHYDDDFTGEHGWTRTCDATKGLNKLRKVFIPAMERAYEGKYTICVQVVEQGERRE